MFIQGENNLRVSVLCKMHQTVEKIRYPLVFNAMCISSVRLNKDLSYGVECCLEVMPGGVGVGL